MNKTLIAIIVISVLAMFITACTGGSLTEEQKQKAAEAAKNAAQDKLEERKDTGTDEVEEETEEADEEDETEEEDELMTGTETEDVVEDLEVIFGQAVEEFQATYDYSVESTTTVTGEMIMYYKGADKVRTDVTAEVAGQTVVTKTYWVDGVYTICTEAGTIEQCVEMDVDEMAAQSQEQTGGQATSQLDDVKANYEDYNLTGLPPQTYAAVLGRCFEYPVETDQASMMVEMCLSEQGILTYMKVEETGGTYTYEMTLKEFSLDVDDSVFDVPEAGSLGITIPGMS